MNKTTKNYWDCECKESYITPRSYPYCSICDSYEFEQPDSRIDELSPHQRANEIILSHLDKINQEIIYHHITNPIHKRELNQVKQEIKTQIETIKKGLK